jgi:hypothetical protein
MYNEMNQQEIETTGVCVFVVTFSIIEYYSRQTGTTTVVFVPAYPVVLCLVTIDLHSTTAFRLR